MANLYARSVMQRPVASCMRRSLSLKAHAMLSATAGPRSATQQAQADEQRLHTGKTVVVAIDGPAAAGKGTLAVALAGALHLAYLDTGLLYRAVGLTALRQSIPLTDEPALATAASQLALSELSPPKPELMKELRSEQVGAAASKVSTLPAVRAAVGFLPKAFAASPPAGCLGVVLDGRDVGTVLFPDAAVKLFVTASDQVRARRRHEELLSKGGTAQYEEVLQDLRERDARDSARAVAPLRPAPGAHILDTSALGTEQALAAALALVLQQCPQLATEHAKERLAQAKSMS